MAAFSLSANTNISTMSGKTGGDTYDTNGFNLTIDQHSRYGTNQTTSTSLGSITINASKGGNVTIDARYVRLIAYTSGSGNVPAYDTTISIGSASGTLIGVYSSLTVAPTAPAAAMPASGYILIRAWNGIAFTSGALTGIGATSSGADVAGWLEIVGDEAATVNANRLGQFIVYGAWYEFLGTTTTGTRTTTYQIPTNGSLTYVPGVMVQSASATITAASWSGGVATFTAAGHGFKLAQEVTVTGASPSGYNVVDAVITAETDNTFSVAIASDPGTWTSGGSAYVYEFYPNAGSRTALVANIATDAVRGKWCWITTGGAVSFGYDGTNSTGGYIVPSGRKLRVANVFLQNCTTAARTANVLPNATLATRYDFTATGGGVVNLDKCSCAWYLSLAQAYSCSLTHTSTFEAATISECASAVTLQNLGIGQTGTANTQIALTMSLNYAGGTIRNCTFSRIAQAASGAYVCSWSDCSGFTCSNNKYISLLKAANATTGSLTAIRLTDFTFDHETLGGGRVLFTACPGHEWTDTVYFDNIATTTSSTIPMNIWELGSSCTDLLFDTLTFGGLTLVQPYSAILAVTSSGCSNIRLRNLGTAAAPLDLGGTQVSATWTRSTTTMTVTKTAHGLKAGDSIAVIASTDVAPKALTTGTSTVWAIASAPTADTFTVTVTNSGQTTGQRLIYYPVMTGSLVTFSAGSGLNPVKLQRCYGIHTRSTMLSSTDNAIKNVTLDNVWGTYWTAALMPMLNCTARNLLAGPTLAAQTACYGTHFIDFYTTEVVPANVSGVSWTRSTTVATVTSTAHGLKVGDRILVTVTSDSAAIVLGIKTLTQPTAVASPNDPANTFTFTCLNAGSASGTLTFTPINGRVGIQMNEPTAETTSQVALTGGSAFTSAGSLYMPTVGMTAEFTSPENIRGHGSFPIDEAVMAGGTIGNYDILYSLDGGTTYRNLYYNRSGGGGSNGSTNVTMTSTTGVEVGDYVWGTNIAPNAKVTSITDSTTVVVDIANTGTVSGVLRFNHLPSETVSDALVGFPLKVKITTLTANTTAITSLYFNTVSTTANRAATFALDTVPITVTVLDVATGSPIENARVFIEAAAGGSATAGEDILTGLTNASGVLTGTTQYTSQPVTGKVRRASPGYGTRYKTSAISSTIGASGLDLTVLMISDE